MTTEQRTYKAAGAAEFRAADDDGQPDRIVGYAAVYGALSQNLGGFVEQVDSRAFDGTLSADAGHDVLAAVNHDPSWLLGTTASGTLAIRSDEHGLGYQIDLDMSDPDAIRAAAKIRTGKLRGSSFAFATRTEEWTTTDQGFPLRVLREVELYELGPVASPAYLATADDDASVALRSLAADVGVPVDTICKAARQGDLVEMIAERNCGADTSGETRGSAAEPDRFRYPTRSGSRRTLAATKTQNIPNFTKESDNV